jgi:hypothetical protein
MKKITCLVCTIAATIFCLNAQSFNGGGFESWEYKDPKNGKPHYYELTSSNFVLTLNKLYSLTDPLGDAPLTAFRETSDVHSGNYSIKLVTDEMYVGDDPILLPGAAGTLDITIVPPGVDLEKPFTHRPIAIRGYVKYVPKNGDSAAIEVILRDGNINTGHGKQVYKTATTDWEEFNIDINYAWETAPKTITVIFAASAKYNFASLETLKDCKGQIGSALYLDDVEFLYGPQGVKEMLTPEIQLNVYPNPSTEKVTVQIEKETNGMVFVYDYLTRKIGEYPIDGTQLEIDVKDYAAGSYLINVVENNKVTTTGRFVKQ